DYMLFENHALPDSRGSRGNDLISNDAWNMPVFVVSYKRGIGKEKEFTQEDFDRIFSEAKVQNFYPCIKGSEYVTRRTWHNLRPEMYTKPSPDLAFPSPTRKKKKHLGLTRPIMKPVIHRWYNPISRAYFERKAVRRILDP